MRPQVLLRVTATEVTGTRRDSPASHEKCSTTLHEPNDLANAIHEVVRQVVTVGAVVRLEVGRPWGDLRTLHDLPPLPEKDLVRLVRGQLDRFFPPRESEVSLGAAWIPESNPRLARAGVVDSWVVKLATDAVGGRGGLITAVSILNFETRAELDILEGPILKHRRRWLLRRAGFAASMALAPWFIAFGVHMTDLALDHRSLGSAVASMEPVEERITSLESSVQKLRNVVEALDRGSSHRAWVADRLGHIAETLPDTIFLQRVELESGGSSSGEAFGSNRTIDLTRILTSLEGGR